LIDSWWSNTKQMLRMDAYNQKNKGLFDAVENVYGKMENEMKEYYM